ncbi:Non-specific serine/threonine protein kinase [Fusarium sp. LHS14.1]|nr:Non-specific serine/threonine protein kinase [Fusarium sp. LHS14.1]
MTPTPSIASDARKLKNNTDAKPDQKTLDEIRRNNHGAAEGFFEKFFKDLPLTGPVTDHFGPSRCRFISRLPETQEEPDVQDTTYHFLFPSTAEYTWSKVRAIGLQLHAGYDHDHDSGFAQLYEYAQQVFRSQPTRLFLHGIYIFGLSMELWVFDRAGMYSCHPFSLSDDQRRAAPIFDTYARMSDTELGMNPILHSDTTGTYILAKEEGKPDQGPSKFYLEDEPIVFPGTIVSEGPTCYRARISTSAKPEFVVKLLWRSQARRSEESMLRLVKERKVSGVIQMYSHQQVDTISNLRRGLTFAPLEGGSATTSTTKKSTFTNLTLNCLVVSPLGRPLSRFHSMEEFLRSFRAAVAGYRSLHLDGKVLHRDISPYNIIIAEMKKEREPWGVLIDLDLSMELAVGPARPGEIMGTKAFMAISVMKRRQRTYRQDLESFLYVLLWIAICGGDRKLPSDSRLQRWMIGNWNELAQKKSEDMKDENFAAILGEFKPQFRGLEGLAYSLRDALFCEGPENGDEGAEELYSAFFSAIDEALTL